MQDPFNSTNAKSLSAYYNNAPKSITKGKGVYLYDGKERFLDCGMALGSVSLGYAYKEVDDFVIKTLRNGVNFSRPSYLEETLTEKLRNDFKTPELIVKYSKSSSMLLSVVPRIARYFTKKKYVAYPQNCFLGNTDWYLSKCINSGGILPEIGIYTITFQAGNCESIEEMFKLYGNDLACIIMEPYRESELACEFYQTLSNLSNKNGVMLIFDETITGYRFFNPLAQNKIKCKPDLTIIGKAFANGYPLACIAGDVDIMQKIESASISNNIFDFSTTHAGEVLGLAAAIKTIDIYSQKGVIEQLNQKGSYLLGLVKNAIEINSLQSIFEIYGQPTYFKISCKMKDYNKIIMSDLFRFFFAHNILFKGIFSVCISHNLPHLNMVSKCFEEYCQHFDLERLVQNYSTSSS